MKSKVKEYSQYALIIVFVLVIRLFVIDVISKCSRLFYVSNIK